MANDDGLKWQIIFGIACASPQRDFKLPDSSLLMECTLDRRGSTMGVGNLEKFYRRSRWPAS